VRPRFEFAGCVQHDTVADHDGVDVGVAGEVGEDAGGDLDGDRELGDRAKVLGRVGIDHRDELGSAATVDAGGGVEEESADGVGVEVTLFLDRVIGTPVGDGLGEQCLDGGVDA
jgi:hypothetical protein